MHGLSAAVSETRVPGSHHGPFSTPLSFSSNIGSLKSSFPTTVSHMALLLQSVFIPISDFIFFLTLFIPEMIFTCLCVCGLHPPPDCQPPEGRASSLWFPLTLPLPTTVPDIQLRIKRFLWARWGLVFGPWAFLHPSEMKKVKIRSMHVFFAALMIVEEQLEPERQI